MESLSIAKSWPPERGASAPWSGDLFQHGWEVFLAVRKIEEATRGGLAKTIQGANAPRSGKNAGTGAEGAWHSKGSAVHAQSVDTCGNLRQTNAMKLPCWRWPRLTLRRAFVLLTLCCVLLAAVAYHGRVAIITVALHQQDAVSLGWHTFDERGYGPRDATIGPEASSGHWLAVSQLDTLDYLLIGQLHVTAQHLQYVPDQITGLTFWECTFDDDALLELRRFYQLRSLRIDDCQLPSLDWEQVRLDDNLKLLEFYDSPGHPQDFAWLSSYRDLTILFFSNTSLDDAMLATLASDTPAERLYIGKTNITDAGVAHLQSWPHLRGLSLPHTQVTDECVPTLVKLQLEELDVRGTVITAAGLAQLVTMPELRKLHCDGACIDDTVAALLNERGEKLELRVRRDSIPLLRLLCDWRGPAPKTYPGPPAPGNLLDYTPRAVTITIDP